jgi:hypothetical protein
MKKFAVLDSSNKVVNIIVAGSKEIAEAVSSSNCVQIDSNDAVSIDYTYDGTTFTAPEA